MSDPTVERISVQWFYYLKFYFDQKNHFSVQTWSVDFSTLESEMSPMCFWCSITFSVHSKSANARIFFRVGRGWSTRSSYFTCIQYFGPTSLHWSYICWIARLHWKIEMLKKSFERNSDWTISDQSVPNSPYFTFQFTLINSFKTSSIEHVKCCETDFLPRKWTFYLKKAVTGVFFN